MTKIQFKRMTPLSVFFFVSVVAIGLFHDYLSIFSGAVLSCIWFFSFRKYKKVQLNLSPAFCFVAVTLLFYGISIFYAVDFGMAIIGFFKFLPLVLFLLILKREDAECIRTFLPKVAAIITIVSAVIIFIPVIGENFLVADRFAGPFQYPNAFAMFLLLSELELLCNKKMCVTDGFCHLILLTGVFFTGSRAVFVLTLLSCSVILLFFKGKRVRLSYLILVVVVIISLGVYSAIFDSFGIFKRVLSLSWTESTFVGRFLYWIDALPQILRNPFGMGYMGYYYTQSSFQTGVYSVTHVHNDFLQILLDIGFIPFAFLIYALIKSFTSKKIVVERKVILATFVLHLLFDFDLQFFPMFVLLLLYLDPFDGKEWECLRKSISPWVTIAFAAALYLGIALAFSRFGAAELAQKIYPWYTPNEMNLLSAEENSQKAEEIADHLLERNDRLLLAHSAKARAAYGKGDFAALIEEKNMILELAPFQYEEYEEYAYMLINGITLYEQSDDTYSAEICKKELYTLTERIEKLPDRLSFLGKRIKDQPETKLPEEVFVYVSQLHGS